MKRKLLPLLFFSMSLGLMAQEEETIVPQPEVAEMVETQSPMNQHAIGVSAGSGLGLSYSYKFNETISLTARYNYLAFEVNDYEQSIDGQNLLFDVDVDFKNIDVLVNYHPFKNAFKIVGGLGYFTDSKFNVSTSFKESIIIGEVEFTPEDIGFISIDSAWEQVSPFVALGFGRAVPNSRIGISIEAGTYYARSPKVGLDATGIIENTKNQEALLQDSFSELRFIPQFSFKISYSI
ncbi:hypothetical protein HCG49_15405 [Arenibacter sp. 6A1]|uniref:hypothetical protein n=1 Tax=Arenibacter sp. 6A1 TaxID=2720391 RepID=UPI001445AFA9|nr:hypothetical protein [Arenibacter sp. 6A1]NKI27948.1 hypothetical protein [Arenibacter sp. 6A1]